jgi:hypothetical protein
MGFELWLRTLLAGRFDDVIFTSGEAVVLLVGLAARLGVSGELQSQAGARRHRLVLFRQAAPS